MKIVGILGGMGPAAGADFVRLFVQACTIYMREAGQQVSDQNFPEHWLAQVPIPDRSMALQDTKTGFHQPLEPMLQSLGRLAAVGAHSVAIACNTAHAWHAQLQSRFPQLELLNIANEVAEKLAAQEIKEVALLATTGTYHTGMYEQALKRQGIYCYLPNMVERDGIMRGIYKGVKANDLLLAQECFEEVVINMTQRHGDIPMILGCTEIPLALMASHVIEKKRCIDPAQILAKALARRAYN
jgi:aspartate racemase